MRRRLLVPALLLSHAAVVAWAIAGTQQKVTAVSPVAIAVTAIAATPLAVPVATPILTEARIEVEAPLIEIAATAPEDVQPAPAGCAVGAAVQAALRSSASVKLALSRMPRDARSVADAVQLWNGQWADPAALGGAGALDPIRAAVAAAVRAAPADCRDARVAGPQLMFVETEGTRVLAFGSGIWTWSQVLESTATQTAFVAASELFST